ncbi:DNA polymerase-3 subunit delta' [bacterium A37T11]|nr:DNA polymerase-3 subunit delta' [bacterium A37T11]
MQFKDIIGHVAVKERLINTVRENRVSHAQLFLGPEGSGSLALALAYAQFINCLDKQESDSCGVCTSCRKYARIIHPDLHFSYPFFAKHKDDTAADYISDWRNCFLNNPYLDLECWRNQLNAENKQANINIAEAHHIIKKLSLKAYEAEYKVLIMWLPEFLDSQGNALLKLIEEPPAKTLFLLVAENPDKLLSTIISRTQLVKVSRPGNDEVAAYLMEVGHVQEQQARQAAFISEGNVQRALNLLNEEHSDHFELLVQWLRYCVTDSGLSLIDFSEDILVKMGRENQKSFILYAISMMRQVLLCKAGAEALMRLSGAEKGFAEKFAGLYTEKQLDNAVEVFEKAHYHIERNANGKILFLDVSLQLVLNFKYATFRREADSTYL